MLHPSVQLNPVELPTRRITSVPLAGDKITHGEITFTIILDENMTGYNEMFNWLQRLVNDGQVNFIKRSLNYLCRYNSCDIIKSQQHYSKN